MTTTDPSRRRRSPVRVVVADDHPVVRDGLAVLLGLQPGIVVVGQAADGEEAVSVVLDARPDVVLIDLRMPLLSGVGAMRRIRAVDPGIRFVVLTTYVDDAEVTEAFRAGALGFLTKDAGRQEICEALVAAAEGRGLVSRGAQHALDTGEAAPATAEQDIPDGLTPRECDVLRLIAMRPIQPGDDGASAGQRGDREDAHQPNLRQGPGARPCTGGALRLPQRAGLNRRFMTCWASCIAPSTLLRPRALHPAPPQG